MEAATGGAPPPIPTPTKQPDTEKIKRKLLQHGVYPTPKIVHTIRKKELQKSFRKSEKKRLSNQTQDSPPLTESQKQALAEESHFRTIRREYRDFNRAVKTKSEEDTNGALMVGKPWERLERNGLSEFSNLSKEYGGEKLKPEYLRELSEHFDERRRDELRWVLDDDIEIEEGWFEKEQPWEPSKHRRGEADTIRFLVDRLSVKELSVKDWKFARMMKQSGLQFTEAQLLKIVGRLGFNGQWRNALSVVEWVYKYNDDKEHKHYKSRFVYTKLLAVLGKARKPHEALQIFNLMRADWHIYPDMAAYHSIAVTLGQAGFLKDLVKIIECMRQKPSKETKNMRRKNWDSTLEPDLVVYNAVLNACVPTRQWKGVSWVFDQLRKSGLKPNGPSYGLAMEVMLQSGKYDHVHELFLKMRRSGEAPKALTYKVLVRAFWEEGKVDEAVEAVRNMEQRGVVGTACVYYELACCLCNKGRWQDAMKEASLLIFEVPICHGSMIGEGLFEPQVEKLKKLPHSKPLEVSFTGMIMSSMDGGYIDDCISIFEEMKDHCDPNTGTINAMLKVYGRNDMFSKAKELFEETKASNSGLKVCRDDNGTSLVPDLFTYTSMLEASARAHQWEYFEYVYKEMALSGYQLDQSKHASLLVEASRAGKWHLLEHAFDTTLEAEEIPHPSVFTEMVCQAATQQNYERAIILVKALAHAPFQITEKQWTNLFEKNGDRISKDCLQKLLDALGNCEVTNEATISNFTRSLHSLCRSGEQVHLLKSIAFGDESSFTSTSDDDDDDGESGGIEKLDGRNLSANLMGGNPNYREFPPNNSSGDITSNIYSVNDAGSDTEDTADIEIISNLNYARNEGETNLSTKLEGFTQKSNKRFVLLENSKYDAEEGELDMGIHDVDDAINESNLPSANEILETWKESRNKDGIFFPFQFGSK